MCCESEFTVRVHLIVVVTVVFVKVESCLEVPRRKVLETWLPDEPDYYCGTPVSRHIVNARGWEYAELD